MMHLGRKLVLAVAVGALLAGAGCKKKPKVVPPTPPTITLPPAEQEPPPTPPPVMTEPLPKVAQPVPKKPKVKLKKPKKNAPAPAEAEKPAKTVIDNTSKPADSNVQISVEVPQSAANLRRQQTEDLLQATEANLRRINRSLSDGEQSMQRQVRNFITQSRLAMQDNDLERAYNLATKANLLSQELVK